MNEIIIKDTDELIKIINSFENHFVFRGQTDSKWPLQCSLSRLFKEKDKEKFQKMENYALNKFKSKFHLYDQTNKKPETKLQWLSLMQHYGVPTRLLDVTTSPYIALYFALENISITQKNNISIFAIDYRELLKSTMKFIKEKDSNFTYEYIDVSNNQDTIFDNYFDRFSYDILWVTEPKEINVRLDRQAGSFLLSGNLENTIQDLLCSDLYNSVESYKLIIPIDFYNNIFALLQKVNINSKVLYGDLPGLALEIKMEMYVYS